MKKLFIFLFVVFSLGLYGQKDTVNTDVVEHIDVFFTDLIYVDSYNVCTDEFVTELVYVTDTIKDTVSINVIEYVELIRTDTLHIDLTDYKTNYVKVFVTDSLIVKDTIVEIEYQTLICDNSNIEEVLDKSFGNNKIYNLNGEKIRRPKSIYIENGKIKYKLNN